jgi:RecA-family ATPase
MLDPVAEFEARVSQAAPRTFLLEGLIPQEPSLSLLCGRPGLGKSILGLHLVYSIACGRPFLGLPTRQAVAGYLTFEGSERSLLERVRLVRKSYPDPGGNDHLGVLSPMRLPGQEDRWLKVLARCQFAVIDPLKFCVAGDYVRPADGVRFLEALMRVLQKNDLAVLFIHHLRKRDPRLLLEPGDIDQIKGAGDYAEAATSVLLLERTRQQNPGRFLPVDPNRRTLYFSKTREAPTALSSLELGFQRQTFSFQVIPCIEVPEFK